MDIDFQNLPHSGSAPQWTADCVILPLYEDQSPGAVAPLLLQQAPWIEQSPARRDFRGKKGELTLIYAGSDLTDFSRNLALPRLLLCGLGKEDKGVLSDFRNTVAGAVKFCRDKAFVRLGLPVEALDALAQKGLADREALLRETVVSALLGLFRPGLYRSGAADEDDPPADPQVLSFFLAGKDVPEQARLAVNLGLSEAGGVLVARRLGNTPANLLSPADLAGEARRIAEKYAFSCRVFTDQEIVDMGMGALHAVGRGSKNGPRLALLEHCPQGKEAGDPLIIVGKGITFDSGGISLKPSANMHEMKSDMGGAAAVLGLFTAIGEAPDRADLPRLIGIIAAAENMPGGNAGRPGDIVTTYSGKTVEILNTDAEGRLVLCDALAYAQKEWKPRALIDLATLTGACVIALGDHGIGLFSTDEELRAAILEAAGQSGDLVWPMPLWDEYDKNLKSELADMLNIGPREGGAIHAALFLRRFIEKDVRWAHLDIAGPGYVVKTAPLHPVPGSTGTGVRLLCRLLRDTAFCSPDCVRH
ncbi:MAG: leucyl aminopeptidase [Desulfovibrio sp.]|jgi:leucyl aminopeptidase|nr:leucyl aminopeptidase [Desulfovibrio sp.]